MDVDPSGNSTEPADPPEPAGEPEATLIAPSGHSISSLFETGMPQGRRFQFRSSTVMGIGASVGV